MLESFKRFLWRSFGYLKQLAKVFLPLYALKEEFPQDGIPLNVIYAGYSKIWRTTYGATIFYGKPYKSVYLGVIGFWRLKKYKTKNFIPEIIIAETNVISTDFFFEQDGCLLPYWVKMKVDLSRPIKELRDKKNEFVTAERLIRKYHWEYEITEDPERLKEFYYNMHVPYMKKHGESALIIGYDIFIKHYNSHSLLVVTQEGVACGGVIIEYGEKVVFMKHIGVSDGNTEHIKHGIVGALYYYSFQESQRRGYREVNISLVLPFLNNGITRYKLRFKGEFILDECKSREYIWLFCRPDSERGRKFLKENPVICVGRDWKLMIV